MPAEVEVLEFLRSLMTTIKRQVVETGAFLGVRAGCRDVRQSQTQDRRLRPQQVGGLPLPVSMDPKVPGTIDLLFCDSLPLLRYRKLKLNAVG
ncbi:MAG TPA: hypothetical protein VKD24_08010 [Candidatus Angelobacter sp.]|nr:hypothetical protein [Candidatus Angelobacter sp.]